MGTEPTPIETIIIGGGISGLACAHKLQSANKDFLVITKDIGGRIKFSENNPKINFGGVYITKDYFNLLPYVDVIEPFRLRDFYFFDGVMYKTLFSFQNITYIPKIISFLVVLWKFRNRLNIMRKNAEHQELQEVIKNDKLLDE